MLVMVGADKITDVDRAIKLQFNHLAPDQFFTEFRRILVSKPREDLTTVYVVARLVIPTAWPLAATQIFETDAGVWYQVRGRDPDGNLLPWDSPKPVSSLALLLSPAISMLLAHVLIAGLALVLIQAE
jgi:hypothetical protein